MAVEGVRVSGSRRSRAPGAGTRRSVCRVMTLGLANRRSCGAVPEVAPQVRGGCRRPEGWWFGGVELRGDTWVRASGGRGQLALNHENSMQSAIEPDPIRSLLTLCRTTLLKQWFSSVERIRQSGTAPFDDGVVLEPPRQSVTVECDEALRRRGVGVLDLQSVRLVGYQLLRRAHRTEGEVLALR